MMADGIGHKPIMDKPTPVMKPSTGATSPFAVSEKRKIGCATSVSLPEKSPINTSARVGEAATMARNMMDRRNADRLVIATQAVIDPFWAHLSTTQQGGVGHHHAVKEKRG